MMKKIVVFAFAISALSLWSLPTHRAAALGPQASECNWGNYTKANTTYVSANAGESNQTQINSAIAAAPSGSSVFLKAGLYTINAPIIIKSNITLEGDKDAIVKLKNHAGWKTQGYTGVSLLDPIIGAGGLGGGNSSHDIEIKCFTMDGNKANNESTAFFSCIKAVGGPHPWAANYTSCDSGGVNSYGGDRYHGNGYYTLIYLHNGSNIFVHDMTMRDTLNDGFKFAALTNVKFYNNYVSGMGHEGVFAMASHDIEVYQNDFRVQASDGVRGSDCYNYIIHDNEFQSLNRKDSSAGIQIAMQHGKPVYNVQIYRNVFHDIWNGGIWFSLALPKYNGQYPVFVHHNLFVGNGYSNNSAVGATGGIIAASNAYSLVYNNVFDGNLGAGVNARTSSVKVINNIITGSKVGRYGGAGNGAGVLGTTDVSYNCFYNNAGGDYPSGSGTGNASGNPLFADQANQDYHLQSRAGRWDPDQKQWVTDGQSSPCIDWGVPSNVDATYGAFDKEPSNNGGRINAGVYGNTTQASLSGTSPQNPMPPAPVEEDYPKGFAGDGGGGDSGEPEPPQPVYWYPTEPILDPDPFVSVDLALPELEIDRAPLFPDLAATPDFTTGACTSMDDSAGFIPCGKNLDDPATAWSECTPCNFCHLALMGQLTIEFLIRMAAVFATLAVTFAGFLYVFAAGKQELLVKAKTMMKQALIGFVIIFVAWAIVDSVLMTLGFIDPIGGSWYTVC